MTAFVQQRNGVFRDFRFVLKLEGSVVHIHWTTVTLYEDSGRDVNERTLCIVSFTIDPSAPTNVVNAAYVNVENPDNRSCSTC